MGPPEPPWATAAAVGPARPNSNGPLPPPWSHIPGILTNRVAGFILRITSKYILKNALKVSLRATPTNGRAGQLASRHSPTHPSGVPSHPATCRPIAATTATPPPRRSNRTTRSGRAASSAGETRGASAVEGILAVEGSATSAEVTTANTTTTTRGNEPAGCVPLVLLFLFQSPISHWRLLCHKGRCAWCQVPQVYNLEGNV